MEYTKSAKKLFIVLERVIAYPIITHPPVLGAFLVSRKSYIFLVQMENKGQF